MTYSKHSSTSLSQQNSFPKTNRLLSPSDFAAVFSNADKLANKHWTFIVRKLHRDNEPRIGLAISKKISKKAVERNRIKRIAREQFRLNKKRFFDFEVVVLARQNTPFATNQELRNSFNHLIKKLTTVLPR